MRSIFQNLRRDLRSARVCLPGGVGRPHPGFEIGVTYHD